MKLRYVNVYMVDRAYGGPEEGGWWYDYGVPLKSMPTTALKAERLCVCVRRWVDAQNEGRVSISSVASEGMYSARIEDHPAQGWPESTHYE